MKKYAEILKNSELFTGITETDLDTLLACLGAKAVKYEKNRLIFKAGEKIEWFGLVLSGQVQVFQDDYYGNRSILSMAGAGSLFGEAFACAKITELPVSVFAPVDCEALMIDCGRLTGSCANACTFHAKLIQNLMTIMAQNNIGLTRKIGFTAKRTTREKLLAYLSFEAQRAKSGSFSIPFNRQELADYLSVDRSAMSVELGKLRDEGVLRFEKNRFELL